MKTILLRLAAVATAFLPSLVSAQSVTLPDASPRASVSQVVGITHVSVDYGRPSVNGRPVWGQLVPYGYNNLGFGTSTAAPWRAGANMNTVVTFEHDVKVAGQPLKAGSYGLSMALEETGKVTVIFSHDAHKWGSFFYEPEHDALRIETQWEDAPHMEQLSYDFSEVKKNSAVLALRWEKKRIPIPFALDTDAIVTANLQRELRGDKQFEYQAWLNASAYLLANNGDLSLALQWADYAISGQFTGQRSFATLSNKVAILNKMGRAAEARPLYDELMASGAPLQLHQLGRQTLAAGNKELALAIFRKNAERHPDVWPVNYGLARGLSAMGDYAGALEALFKAEKQIPAGDTQNTAAIKANIEKLKAGKDIN
jgi:hypothetical protein